MTLGYVKGRVHGEVELGCGVTNGLLVWISNSVNRKIGRDIVMIRALGEHYEY